MKVFIRSVECDFETIKKAIIKGKKIVSFHPAELKKGFMYIKIKDGRFALADEGIFSALPNYM